MEHAWARSMDTTGRMRNAMREASLPTRWMPYRRHPVAACTTDGVAECTPVGARRDAQVRRVALTSGNLHKAYCN